VTATETTSTSPNPSPRLKEFQSEVDELKVTGGKANPERVWVILSAIGMIVGVVLGLVGWILTQGTKSNLDFASYNAMGNFGIALTFASAAVFTVMSLRRYFRFWLVRLIFELREQTDSITGSD
jgi:hypothetical protein